MATEELHLSHEVCEQETEYHRFVVLETKQIDL